MRRLLGYPELLIITFVAILTHFWSLFYPRAVVFDEVYFKVFAGHYLDGHYFFDIHPPLSKLLLAGWAHLLGLSSGDLLNGPALGLRILPALAGVLIVPVFWAILRRLGARRMFAALGAALLVLDNALTVESRFILTDPLLLLFGLLAIWCYLVARDRHGRKRWLWLSLAAIAGGAAASTKWTGLSALAIIGVTWLVDVWPERSHWRRLVGEGVMLITLPLLVYMSSFALHFALLPMSGDGDAFMSTRFQSTLQGNALYNPEVHLNFFDKFSQLNVEMFKANQTLTATHPYASRWYTWPLELRGIYYWEGDALTNGSQGNIYLLGNPLIWWGIPLALIAGVGILAWRRQRLRTRAAGSLTFLGLAYAINLAPFMAVTRVMFLYHYFFSFIFSLAAVVLLWQDIASHSSDQQSVRRWVIIIGLIAALGFIYFAPLTYGSPLTPTELQQHIWLKSWR